MCRDTHDKKGGMARGGYSESAKEHGRSWESGTICEDGL